jgi:hypothetical protein
MKYKGEKMYMILLLEGMWNIMRGLCKEVWSRYLKKRCSEFEPDMLYPETTCFVSEITKYKLYFFVPFRFHRKSLMNSLMLKMKKVIMKALINHG